MFLALFVLPIVFLGADGAPPDHLTQADCPPPTIDFSDRMGPARSQGRASSCFAFTAADLITFNQNLPPGVRVSALDVELHALFTTPEEIQKASYKTQDWSFAKMLFYGEDLQVQGLQGKPLVDRFSEGSTSRKVAIAYNSSHGLCTEDQLPSEESPAFKGSVDYIFRQFGPKEPLSPWNRDLFLSPVLVPKSPSSKTSALLGIQKNCPSINLSGNLLTFNEELHEAAAKTQAAEIQKRCGERRPLKPMAIDTISTSTPELKAYTSVTLAGALRMGIPVGIGYDSRFLKAGESSPVQAADHASSIVGLRWNPKKNRCEFKLRNSWGPSCEVYHPSLRDSCEAGHLWLSEETLKARVDSIYVIKPQSN